MHVLKRVELRVDPCRTPQMISFGPEEKGGRQIFWVLPVRKDAIHLRVSLGFPSVGDLVGQCSGTRCRRLQSMRRIRAGVSPLLTRALMSWVVVFRAVFVL